MRYKPFVLVTTPIGVAWGIYEGFKLAGSVAVIIIAQVFLIGLGVALVVRMIRKEKITASNKRSADD